MWDPVFECKHVLEKGLIGRCCRNVLALMDTRSPSDVSRWWATFQKTSCIRENSSWIHLRIFEWNCETFLFVWLTTLVFLLLLIGIDDEDSYIYCRPTAIAHGLLNTSERLCLLYVFYILYSRSLKDAAKRIFRNTNCEKKNLPLPFQGFVNEMS